MNLFLYIAVHQDDDGGEPTLFKHYKSFKTYGEAEKYAMNYLIDIIEERGLDEDCTLIKPDLTPEEREKIDEDDNYRELVMKNKSLDALIEDFSDLNNYRHGFYAEYPSVFDIEIII